MEIAYSFKLNGRGRVADASPDEHIRQMMEQLLFTIPGERVNRPDFGCGLQQLVFEPNSDELTATTEFLVQGALQQWLGDRIILEGVTVESEESQLKVTIQYVVRQTQQPQVATFSRGISSEV